MNPVAEISTFLSLRDEKGRIEHKFILIVAGSGWGKTFSAEAIIEKYHKAGFLVIWVADPKKQIEGGFSMFPPKEPYHLEQLRIQGTRPSTKKVKLYHPFTFNIPKNYLPEINFYTFSLKDLTRVEANFFTESFSDTDTTKLLLSAIQNISKEDGIMALLHYLQAEIKGKKKGRDNIPDWKNFGLSVSMGTTKSLQDISNYFQLFKRDYFLAKDNCPINLNIKEILQDQEHYHVFTSKWIDDEKLRGFCVLSLLNKIARYSDYAKHPVLIVIPEIRLLCPMKPEGYKIVLSNLIKENLSNMRSTGKGGMSSIMDSQVFEDIDEDVVDSCTKQLVGQLGGSRDIERICKALGWGKDIRNDLKRMGMRNTFYLVGYENMGAFRIFAPSHMHKEENYNFFDMYKQYYPEKMKKYDGLISTMQKIYDDEENKIREKLKRTMKEEKLEREKKDKERVVKNDVKEEKLVKKVKTLKSEKEKLEREKVAKFFVNNPNGSSRSCERETGIGRNKVRRIISDLKMLSKDKMFNQIGEDNENEGENGSGEDRTEEAEDKQ